MKASARYAATRRQAPRAQARWRWRALVPAVLMLVASVAAQAVALTHELDPAAHPAGEACALCVSTSTLGAGHVGAAQAILAAAGPETPVSASPTLFGRGGCGQYRARAPPLAS